jgi:hypothetical protein
MQFGNSDDEGNADAEEGCSDVIGSDGSKRDLMADGVLGGHVRNLKKRQLNKVGSAADSFKNLHLIQKDNENSLSALRANLVGSKSTSSHGKQDLYYQQKPVSTRGGNGNKSVKSKQSLRVRQSNSQLHGKSLRH